MTFYRILSIPFISLFEKLKIRPLQVTLISVFPAIAGFLLFLKGYFLYGLGAFTLSLVLDCADGNLAKRTSVLSAFGGYFDSIADRIVDCLLYSGLAFGLYAKEPSLIILTGGFTLLCISFITRWVWTTFPKAIRQKLKANSNSVNTLKKLLNYGRFREYYVISIGVIAYSLLDKGKSSIGNYDIKLIALYITYTISISWMLLYLLARSFAQWYYYRQIVVDVEEAGIGDNSIVAKSRSSDRGEKVKENTHNIYYIE